MPRNIDPSRLENFLSRSWDNNRTHLLTRHRVLPLEWIDIDIDIDGPNIDAGQEPCDIRSGQVPDSVLVKQRAHHSQTRIIPLKLRSRLAFQRGLSCNYDVHGGIIRLPQAITPDEYRNK